MRKFSTDSYSSDIDENEGGGGGSGGCRLSLSYLRKDLANAGN